jgi:hypothetical protein
MPQINEYGRASQEYKVGQIVRLKSYSKLAHLGRVGRVEKVERNRLLLRLTHASFWTPREDIFTVTSPALRAAGIQPGQRVRLRPGRKPFTDIASTGKVVEVRDNELRLQLGIQLRWVPRSAVIRL